MDHAIEPILENAVPLPVAADVQEHLVAACNDLDRLQALLAEACDVLMASFRGAAEQLDAAGASRDDAHAGLASASIRRHLGGAITALQFHDLSSQLIGHTRQRLRGCADRLALEAFGCDDDGEGVVEEIPAASEPGDSRRDGCGFIELFR